MSTAVAPATALPLRARGSNRWAFWGTMMVVPYLLVFLVFVLYPVGYGLWLARHPASYEKLFEDPIFFRTVINTGPDGGQEVYHLHLHVFGGPRPWAKG